MDDELGYELQKRNTKREVYDWIESLIFALVCIVLLFTFIGRVVVVDGHSMEPTLSDQERLISSRLFYKPQSGDIVVITQPNDRGEALIKRVVATEGQTIDIDFERGDVYVDDVLLNEPYILEKTHQRDDVVFPQTVPEGHVFVMGDNRNNSWDSRSYGVGMIDTRYILGRVLFRLSLLDWDRMGNPDAYWKEAV